MQRKRVLHRQLFKQISVGLGIGLAAFLLLFLFLNLAVSLMFIGRVMPGVSMNGIPLAGKTVEEAAATITSLFRYPDTGTIMLVDGDKSWVVRPAQLGFYLDPVASAQSAYNTGRRGGITTVLLQRWDLIKGDIEAQPVFIFDEKTAVSYLNSLAVQINQSVHEAGISIEGTQVIVQDGQQGRALDVSLTLEDLTRQVQSMQDGIVPLAVRQSNPVILSAEAQGELARQVLSQPLTLILSQDAAGQTESLQISPSDLAPLLGFKKVADGDTAQFQITTNETLMSAWLTSMKDDLERTPENSRFIFNDETRQLDLFRPAVIGRSLDVEGSIAAIDLALQQGEHTASLSFSYTNPAVTDQMTGAELGITELVSFETTYFAGSDADRVQNITTASEKFKGLLVAPGETLSMVDVLGDISLENGYAEALIILGDETIKGVGGGVCQVSTTLFRTVFFGGYQIDERHPHAYRVGYYEQENSAGYHDSSLAGLDATVYVPIVDFKFTNDSPYWLLMETYVNPSYHSLQWKFYSTSDGREVSYDLPGPTNVVDALETVYRENLELPEGTIKHVDYAVEGADVNITRAVTRGGETIHQDRFFTRYEPWGDVYEYGPGTDVPTPTPSP